MSSWRSGRATRPDGAWGELLAACRDALDHPGPPVAAIGLVIEGPGRLRLEHRGSESLRVGLGAVIAETVVYRDGAQAGLAQSRSADGAVDAGPGWRTTIEIEPLDAAGASLVASVSLSANDAGVWVPVRCEVTATRRLTPAFRPRAARSTRRTRPRRSAGPSLRYSRSVARTRSAIATGRSSAAARYAAATQMLRMLPPESLNRRARKSRSMSSARGSVGGRLRRPQPAAVLLLGHREVDDRVEAADERLVDVRRAGSSSGSRAPSKRSMRWSR